MRTKGARRSTAHILLLTLLLVSVLITIAVGKRFNIWPTKSSTPEPTVNCVIEDPTFIFGPTRRGERRPTPKEFAEFDHSYYLYVFGANSLLVSDAAGRWIELVHHKGDFKEFEDVAYERIPLGDGMMFVLPIGKAFIIEATAQPDSKLWIQLIRGLDNVNPEEIIRYKPLALPTTGKARLIITPQGVEPLRVDENGKGGFERIVEPAVSVRGDEADDLEGPKISVNTAAQGTNVVVTITAQDQSGVKAIFYTTQDPGDPSTYSIYQGPIVVDPNRTSLIYVAAEDGLWNFSGATIKLREQPAPEHAVAIEAVKIPKSKICFLQK